MSVAGKGLINSLINSLPVEVHLPGYSYCGPGTKLQKRLQRGDPGINPLDRACKVHDIAYSKYTDLEHRHQADKVLAEQAWRRFKSKDAGFGERAASLTVTGIMKAKRKLGMGVRQRQQQRKKRATCSRRISKKRKVGRGATSIRKKRKLSFKGGLLKDIITAVRNVSAGGSTAEKMIRLALAAARKVIKSRGGKKNINVPRIIPIPKEGGFLPFLIPLFAGLSATGALAGGISGIAKAVNAASAAKKAQNESQRHNNMMEAIALGKKGNALYLRPYKSGSALYLKPYSKN